MVMLLKPMTCAHGQFFSQNCSNVFFFGTTTKVLHFIVLCVTPLNYIL